MNLMLILGLSVCAVALLIYFQKRNIFKKLKKLRSYWGLIPEDAVDIETAKLFFKLKKSNFIENSYTIDDDTWHDMDMDEIFKLINRATTPTGAQYLYYLLKQPVLSEEILWSRENFITQFSENQKLREKIKLCLLSLQDKNAKYLPYSLWKSLPAKPNYARVLPFLSFCALAVLILVVLQLVHFSILIPIFVINLIIRHLVKRKIEPFIYSFQYLGVLIGVADKISSIKDDNLKDIQNKLRKNLADTKSIADKIFALQLKDELGLIEYFKIYFLLDISGFYSALDKIHRHLEDLRKIYEIIGNIDSLISIASFRQEYKGYCIPSFPSNPIRFDVHQIYHPLLESPVANSFDFRSKNFLITGLNMSGKTTFLKTIGVNVILAQTIHTGMAEKYQAPFLKVISSIERTDSILNGKSYYLTEVESILRIINASESNINHLFLVDEIFRGTNSVERFAASIEVLLYLANNKDYTLVATHDLQLSETLSTQFMNYHFREKVDDNGLSFDYKIHLGPSTTRNAIALLDFKGYPKNIVNGALQRTKSDRLMVK